MRLSRHRHRRRYQSNVHFLSCVAHSALILYHHRMISGNNVEH